MRKLLQTLKSWYNNLTHLHIHGVRKPINTSFHLGKDGAIIDNETAQILRYAAPLNKSNTDWMKPKDDCSKPTIITKVANKEMKIGDEYYEIRSGSFIMDNPLYQSDLHIDQQHQIN